MNYFLGNVAPNGKGEWSDSIAYNKNDVVSYNGSSYLALADTTAGVLPTNTSYWMTSASKGSTGDTGATGATGPAGQDALISYDYLIQTTDDPQTVINSAEDGSIVAFTTGVHEHGLTSYNSMIYIDKPLTLMIPDGCELKVSDSSMTTMTSEIITNFHTSNPLSGVTASISSYTEGENFNTYEISIDSTGDPDTFKYRVYSTGEWSESTAITGSAQTILNGVTVTFASTTGHTLNAGALVVVGGAGYWPIRIGNGTNSTQISGVKIYGGGTINQNVGLSVHNTRTNGYASVINAGIIVSGKIDNVIIDNIRFSNTQRQVVVIGENVGGTYNSDGTVTGGTSYDVSNVTIRNCKSFSTCEHGILFGMPDHRGNITNIICENNYVYSGSSTGIECNNLLNGFIVTGNKIETSGISVSCWRYSKNGYVLNNVGIGSSSAFSINQPSGWNPPENIYNRNNVIVSSISGVGNINDSIGGVISNGLNYTHLLGNIPKANFTFQDVFACGGIVSAGDAQYSRVICKGQTTGNTATVIYPSSSSRIEMPSDSAYAFRIIATGRQSDGSNYAMYEAKGLINKIGSNTPTIYGLTVTAIHESDAAWNFEVVASGTYKTLVTRVTGNTGQTVKWVAYCELIEVGFPS